MYRILVVDDNAFNLSVVKKILEDEYEVVTFRAGKEVLSYLQDEEADLILLDYLMPEMDGMEVLSRLRKSNRTESIPVVILTASDNADLEASFLKAGAEDFVTKPISPEVVRSRIDRILELKALRENLQNRLNEKTRQMESILLQAFTTVANIVDGKGDFTENHSINVAQTAALIGRELGWSEEEIQNIYYIGLLHDIGKVSVPDRIISKAGALTDEEWKIMQGHTSTGADILKNVHIVKGADLVALYHHERYDGTGYPNGLKGEEIPIEARIVHLANAYDAMISNYIYQEGYSAEQIIADLEDGKNKQFDPMLVDILVKMIREKRFEEKDELLKSLNDMREDAQNSQFLFKVMETNTKNVKREAMKDSLTGIYNRQYVEKCVNAHLRENKNCAYFMMDMDNFKLVNDRYGHIEGDNALKDVANMLQEIAKSVGIACRVAGDEFSLFVNQEFRRKDLDRLASFILQEYGRVKMQRESTKETSLSIGIALAPEDGTSYQDLYNAADKALYLSKRAGKNRYSFYNVEQAEQKSD